MRRSWLKGVVDVTKRYLIAAAAHNLGRILRKLFGIGKPKTLQGGYAAAALRTLAQLATSVVRRWTAAIAGLPQWTLAIDTRQPRPVAA